MSKFDDLRKSTLEGLKGLYEKLSKAEDAKKGKEIKEFSDDHDIKENKDVPKYLEGSSDGMTKKPFASVPYDMVKKEFMAKRAMEKKEMGVHEAGYEHDPKGKSGFGSMKLNPGKSSAGIFNEEARQSEDDSARQDHYRHSARQEHKDKLSELKAMPKPNLPKSELEKISHEDRENFDRRYKAKMVHHSKLNPKQQAQASSMYPHKTPVSEHVGHNKPIGNENYHYQLNSNDSVSGHRHLSNKGLHEGRLNNLKAMPKPNLPKSEDIMYKDTMPYPSDSPKATTHDSAEQHESIDQALKGLKHQPGHKFNDLKAKFFDHLRNRKGDPSPERSPENKEDGMEKARAEDHPNYHDADKRLAVRQSRMSNRPETKGVHSPLIDKEGKHYSTDKGASHAGSMAKLGTSIARGMAYNGSTRNPISPSESKSHIDESKRLHSRKLSELKAMPKPNLPKAEMEKAKMDGLMDSGKKHSARQYRHEQKEQGVHNESEFIHQGHPKTASSAGMWIRNANKYGKDMRSSKNLSYQEAKNQHKEKLKELRHMDAPKLPKSEIQKDEHQPHPGASRSEHQKIYDAKKQASEEAHLKSPQGDMERQKRNAPLERLKHHVTGAIERGEKKPIISTSYNLEMKKSYVSEAQRKFFHTNTARKEGISAATTHEFDEKSKGLKLPEHAHKSEEMGKEKPKGSDIIGHTSSGKKVYRDWNHPEHHSWSREERGEAAVIHSPELKDSKKIEKSELTKAKQDEGLSPKEKSDARHKRGGRIYGPGYAPEKFHKEGMFWRTRGPQSDPRIGQAGQPTEKYASKKSEPSMAKSYPMLKKEWEDCNLQKKHVGFKAVEEHAKEEGASDPAAVAAAVGRKKYGNKKFQEMAAAGKHKKSELTKAKQDEGLSPQRKASARAKRNDRRMSLKPEKTTLKQYHNFDNKGGAVAGKKGQKIYGEPGKFKLGTHKEKGVHQGSDSNDDLKGRSSAGINAEWSKKHKTDNFREHARQKAVAGHSSKLAELKAMPKPNLPKSSMMKDESSPTIKKPAAQKIFRSPDSKPMSRQTKPIHLKGPIKPESINRLKDAGHLPIMKEEKPLEDKKAKK